MMITTNHATIAMIALGLALSACDSGDKADDKAGGKATKKGKRAEATVADVFSGDTPALPAEVAAAEFGKPEKDVLAKLGADNKFIISETFKGITYKLRFDKQAGLDEVEVSTNAPVQDDLAKLWGDPIVNKDGEAFWFNPQAGLRASLPEYAKGKDVKFERYTPVSAFFGDGGKVAFFGDKPLFGATVDELHKAWGDALCNFEEQSAKIKQALTEPNLNARRDKLRNSGLSLCLPLFELTPRQERARIDFGAHGKARRLAFSIETGNSDSYQKQVIAALDKALGTALENTEGKEPERFYFNTEAKLRTRAVLSSRGSISVIMNPYMPLDELFGGDGPSLSIENPAMLGGTFEDNQKADPTHYYTAGGETASLIYPPTEFTSSMTDVRLEIYAKRKKVHGYRLVVHYSQFPSKGETVFELLKAKFGEPKRDKKRSTDKDEYFNFKKSGYKVVARRVSNQWQITVSKK